MCEHSPHLPSTISAQCLPQESPPALRHHGRATTKCRQGWTATAVIGPLPSRMLAAIRVRLPYYVVVVVVRHSNRLYGLVVLRPFPLADLNRVNVNSLGCFGVAESLAFCWFRRSITLSSYRSQSATPHEWSTHKQLS